MIIFNTSCKGFVVEICVPKLAKTSPKFGLLKLKSNGLSYESVLLNRLSSTTLKKYSAYLINIHSITSGK